MKCKSCNKDFWDILKHIRKNVECQKLYDIVSIVNERRLKRLEKQRNAKKEHYEQNRDEILTARKVYYVKNRADICEKYKKSRGLIFQRRRFKRYFREKHALSYLSQQQMHLYHHINGFCQPETIQCFNHSVEFYDGLCDSCGDKAIIKLIGVNRLVCLNCKKAFCNICKTEVDPDPYLGAIHYWPPGCTLDFIPGYCPLYSTYPADYTAVNSQFPAVNQKDCRMCEDIIKDYPEYELFAETETKKVGYTQSVNVKYFKCNLCSTKRYFVCEFDHHLRSHTKYGRNIAIVGFTGNIQEYIQRHHIEEKNYATFENEFMKIEGVVAVLAIVWKNHLQDLRYTTYYDEERLKDINLVAALLIEPEIDINPELSVINANVKLFDNVKVLEIKNHVMPDSHDLKFENIFRWIDPQIPCEFVPKPTLRDRNTALLTTRCSLSYPFDRYQSVSIHSHLFPPESLIPFQHNVLRFLWNVIKYSDLCCCTNKFYCSSSTKLEKCSEGCCKKCSAVELSSNSEESSDSESSTSSILDSELETTEVSSQDGKSESEEFLANLSS